MKTHYLISRETKNYRKRMVMLTPIGNLEIECFGIKTEYDINDDFQLEINWYKKNCDMIDSDKETFDAFHIEIANELNSFNNKVTLETV